MPDFIYAQEDVPPPFQLLMLSVQQGMLMFLGTLFPVMLVAAIGGEHQTAVRMVSMTMIASGCGTILQAMRSRWVGSGYLCPNVGGPSYLAVSMNAAMIGGLPLMQGMIVFCGLTEVVLARVINYLRFLFPPLVVGLTVLMVGISIVPMSFADFCGAPLAGDSILWQDVAVGCFTLLAIVGFNLWGKKAAKLYCLLLGIFAGWVLYLYICPLNPELIRNIGQAEVFSFPFNNFSQFRLSFDAELALPFLIISICGSLKTFGNLLAAQKITQPGLHQIEMKPIVGGLTADGISTALSGLIGAIAVDTSASNVGLAAATKAVSRWIGVGVGILFVILGCFPVVAAVISLMPPPVIGAALIFAVSFMVIAGIQEIMSVKMDSRKIFATGLATIFGLSSSLVPGPFAQLPEFISPMFATPLTATTLLAIIFYQLFHIDLTIEQARENRRQAKNAVPPHTST